jgi:hypothetical protein
MARKRELSYILNKYQELFYEETDRKYFPETYLIPEQLEDYKKIHRVDWIVMARNILKGYTLARLTEEVKVLVSR